ncbi:hypothetical protein D6833_13825, partial [Candidatus Parcubacteria bacterium]
MNFPVIDRLSWKLGLATAGIVILCQLAGFFVVQGYFSKLLIRKVQEHTILETQLMSQALEYQMLEKDDHLMRKLVHSFAERDSFRRIMILNRRGEVKFSSDQELEKTQFSERSPTCLVCHDKAPEQRSKSVLLTLEGGEVLRCVLPVLNRPPCHQCHEPSDKINGLIVVDTPLSQTMAEAQRTIGWLGLATSLVGLALLGGIGYVVRNLV